MEETSGTPTESSCHMILKYHVQQLLAFCPYHAPQWKTNGVASFLAHKKLCRWGHLSLRASKWVMMAQDVQFLWKLYDLGGLSDTKRCIVVYSATDRILQMWKVNLLFYFLLVSAGTLL